MANDPKFTLFGDPPRDRVVNEAVRKDVIEGEAEHGIWLYSEDAQTGSKYGLWVCTAGKFRAKMDGYTEFCHIIEGEAHITSLNDGQTRTVRAGDSFVMTAGLELEWHVPFYVKKCFSISRLRDEA